MAGGAGADVVGGVCGRAITGAVACGLTVADVGEPSVSMHDTMTAGACSFGENSPEPVAQITRALPLTAVAAAACVPPLALSVDVEGGAPVYSRPVFVALPSELDTCVLNECPRARRPIELTRSIAGEGKAAGAGTCRVVFTDVNDSWLGVPVAANVTVPPVDVRRKPGGCPGVCIGLCCPDDDAVAWDGWWCCGWWCC